MFMEKTYHTIHYRDSRDMSFIGDDSIHFILTSPPYPMIRMWDGLFSTLHPSIKESLEANDGQSAFHLMHQELDKVWQESYRVLKDGGIACINIGDATRTIGHNFRLYSNHSRILETCSNAGFDILPMILWRKSTNAPNKFMGSGMLPAGAYVTLEHEYILIVRKNGKRLFKNEEEKKRRRESGFFWEERNAWFSDIWEIGGKKQKLDHDNTRARSAAFPFRLACRLIAMYSVRGDTVLDPFLGTGTTMFAAMGLCRNSIGVEIDANFTTLIDKELQTLIPKTNRYMEQRLQDHEEFVESYQATKGALQHSNIHYGFPVMTGQEKEIIFYFLDGYTDTGTNCYQCTYTDKRDRPEAEKSREQSGQLLLEF
jgi:DNA modification methylase